MVIRRAIDPSSAMRLGARFTAPSRITVVGLMAASSRSQAGGHVAHIALQTGVTVDKTDEGLGVVTMFDLIHFSYSLGVRSIATDSPYGIGRVEDDAAFFQNLHGVFDVFFLCHINLYIIMQRYIIFRG